LDSLGFPAKQEKEVECAPDKMLEEYFLGNEFDVTLIDEIDESLSVTI